VYRDTDKEVFAPASVKLVVLSSLVYDHMHAARVDSV